MSSPVLELLERSHELAALRSRPMVAARIAEQLELDWQLQGQLPMLAEQVRHKLPSMERWEQIPASWKADSLELGAGPDRNLVQ